MAGHYYEIRVEGTLGPTLAVWFEGLDLEPGDNRQTILKGWLPDQSALHGVIYKIRDLGLELVALKRIDETLPKQGLGKQA